MENTDAKVIDLQAFRTRKTLVGDRKTGVQQTFRPASSAQSAGSSQPNRSSEADLSARIERIKSSISRINSLMSELRTMSLDGKSPSKDQPKQ
jgi:hypothetical protein